MIDAFQPSIHFHTSTGQSSGSSMLNREAVDRSSRILDLLPPSVRGFRGKRIDMVLSRGCLRNVVTIQNLLPIMRLMTDANAHQLCQGTRTTIPFHPTPILPLPSQEMTMSMTTRKTADPVGMQTQRNAAEALKVHMERADTHLEHQRITENEIKTNEKSQGVDCVTSNAMLSMFSWALRKQEQGNSVSTADAKTSVDDAVHLLERKDVNHNEQLDPGAELNSVQRLKTFQALMVPSNRDPFKEGETFSQFLDHVQETSKQLHTSAHGISPEMGRMLVAAANQSSFHSITVEDVFRQVDLGEVVVRTVRDLRTGSPLVTVDYGAGDNTFGAMFDESTGHMVASVQDGDLSKPSLLREGEMLHEFMERMEVLLEHRYTSTAGISPELARMIMTAAGTAPYQSRTLEDVFNQVDEGEVLVRRVVDPNTNTALTVVDYGAGDNTFGAMFDTVSGKRLVDIHDSDLVPAGSPAVMPGRQGDRPAPIPRSWKKLDAAKAQEAFAEIVNEGMPLSVRTPGGHCIPMDAEDYSHLVSSGDVVLYRNPREVFEPENNTWSPGFYLVFNKEGSLGTVAIQLDAATTRSNVISDAVTESLKHFHAVVHAARVNGLAPGDLARIKTEVHAVLPLAEQAAAEFKLDVAQWQTSIHPMRNCHLDADQRKLVDAMLDAVTPSNNAIGMTLEAARNIFTADRLIYDRPEILSVDPGFTGLRVELDVPTLIANGGTMLGYVEALRATLKDGGVTGAVDVEPNYHLSTLQGKIAQTFLVPAVGQDNVDQMGHQGYESDASLRMEFHVKPTVLETARSRIPAILEFLRPYAFRSATKPDFIQVVASDA